MNRSFRICLLAMMIAPLGALAQRTASPALPEILSGLEPAKANRFTFQVTQAKLVRLEVAGDNNQPCIDELEVYGPASDKNLALASSGAKVTASSCLPGYPDRHRIEFLNDGRYGYIIAHQLLDE